jgi:hypothetical protein
MSESKAVNHAESGYGENGEKAMKPKTPSAVVKPLGTVALKGSVGDAPTKTHTESLNDPISAARGS